MKINLGTDGWRAVIAEDYNFENVRRVVRGIAAYLLWPQRKKLPLYVQKHPEASYPCNYRSASRGVAVGYDSRLLSPEVAGVLTEEIGTFGIPVFLSREYCTTPALSFSARDLELASGIMIAANHNPPICNGIKFKPEYAGSAMPMVVQEIEHLINQNFAPGTGF